VVTTALAGLALVMEKEKPNGYDFGEGSGKAKYAANIRKAADWLMDKSQAGRDGLIFSEHPSETARYMEGHGLAVLFFAGVCKDERDDVRRKKLNHVLVQAVKYIVKSQSSQGGWYHTSKVEGHDLDSVLPTVIQIQALQAAENAGIPVPAEAINDAQEYLKTALGIDEAGARAGQNPGGPVETAAALACSFGRFGRSHDLCKQWFKYCDSVIPRGRHIKLGRDELTHYYYAQALFNHGNDSWSAYRTAMVDRLQSAQNKDGSWPPADGISVGQVYATALWCIILQLDARRHPSTPPPPDTGRIF